MNRRSLVRKSIIPCIGLIALTTLLGAAAPTPDAARQRRETFEALKKKLPQVVADVAKSESWLLERDPDVKVKVKVKLVRRIAADEAKIVMVAEEHDLEGRHQAQYDEYLIIYLRYFDVWTTTRFEGSWSWSKDRDYNISAHALMLAIDQIGEK